MEVCLEMDVKMVACTPTLEMTGVTQADLVEGVKVGGAADYLDFGLDANINLFI
jgi:predicted peroxiredoxin